MDERQHQLNAADEPVVAMAEAELRRALAIEPSAEFEAKVRARISDRPVRSVAWREWLPLAAAAAAAIVAAIAALVVFQLRGTTPPAPVTAIVRPSAQPPASTALSRSPESAAPDATTLPRVQRVHHRPSALTARGDAAEPEVLVDPAVASAVRRLFAMTQRGVALPEEVTKPVEAPVELTVAPLVVEPLQVPTIERRNQ